MDMQFNLSFGSGAAAPAAPAVAPSITSQPNDGVYDGVTPVDVAIAASGSPTPTCQWYSRPRNRVVTIDNVGGYDENATTVNVVDAAGVGITDIMVRGGGEVMDVLSKGTGGAFDVTRGYVGTPSAIADGEELGHYDLMPDETSTTLSVQPSEHTDYICIVSNEVGRAISNVARVILALDTAYFTGFYDGETASLTLTGSDIDSYLSVGSVATNCALLSGGKNTQVTNQLNGHPISRRTTGADNWYRASANADTVITEEEGFFAFAVKPSTVAAINTLWAMETPSRGKVSVRDVSGTTKARVALGTGGAAVSVDSTALTLDVWNLITVRYRTVGGHTQVKIQLNDAAEQTATGTGGISLTALLGQRFQILADGGTECASGDSGFVAINDFYPTDDELAIMKAQFRAKFPALAA